MTPIRLTVAYALDLITGDPEWFPHPVRLFGKLIQAGERWLRPWARTPRAEVVAGATLTTSVVSLAWMWGKPRAVWWQIPLAWTTLATRNLLDESRAVI